MWPGWSSWAGHQRHRLATGAGVLIGIAQSGTTYSVVYGVIGRVASAEKRVWAMGIAAAAGSFGQFLMTGGTDADFHHGLAERAVHPGIPRCFMPPLALTLREPKMVATPPAITRPSAKRRARHSATAISSC
jgi:hypothetical protein